MARTTTNHVVMTEGVGRKFEEAGTSTMLPGHLLEYEANGYVQKHSEADGPAFIFALETQTPDTNQYPQTATIDIPYADGETIYCVQPESGDVINAKLADGESVTKGRHFLASDGAGSLASVGTGNVSVGSANPVGVAWETLDNSGGGTAVRCLVRVI